MSDTWYKNAIIYQIYPRSFADGNNDGIGDLAGITEKVDYLKDLGVAAIWLSPIYASPMADFGYDISDYRQIDPAFGDLEDFDRMIEAAHQNDIKVLMDLVPNHTSDQHEWFEQSRSSQDDPKRNWYIWKDPKTDGSAPNNWQSVFGGPAWTYDPKTDQYYMHSFLKEQPDLNWANPKVRKAMADIMRFWYERGVDGFRVDAILFTSKDLEFRDNPEPKTKHGDILGDEFETAFSHGVTQSLPDYIKVLTDVTKEYPGRCLFLEAYPDNGDPAGYARLYEFIDQTVAAPFYFGLFGATYDWQAQTFHRLVDDFQKLLPADAFPVYVMGNHDTSRLATRIGENRLRAAAVAQLTLPGTKFVYYGEEIGMQDVEIPAERLQDPSNVSRDPERTPMRWTDGANAGFSTVEPWLPTGPGFESQNVATLLKDKQSLLSLYTQLGALHRSHAALSDGAFEPVTFESPSVFGFRRVSTDEQCLVLVNFTDKKTSVTTGFGPGTLLLTSTLAQSGNSGDFSEVSLDANEAVIIKLDV